MDDISTLLEDMTLEDILEHCNITPEEVLNILINGGYIELPPFLEHLAKTKDDFFYE